MPRFVLKWKVRGRANRERPDEVVEKSEVVLGSRPLADVYVNDRLVPQEALVLHFDGATLSMEVRARLAGVFVDGRPVEGRGPVRPGATIQIGHALIETSTDAAKGECVLATNEQYLAQAVDSIVIKAKPAKAFALVDSGPQEHRWGKSPVMRRANWIAALVGLVVLAAFPFIKNSEAMTRGPLFHAHAIGALGGPKDCAACHEPFASRYAPKCVECHKGFDSTTTHPYARNADADCAECHAEHVGAQADILPPMKKAASGWPQTCLRCHAGSPFPETPSPEIVAQSKPKIRDARGETFKRQLLVDGFSHSWHRAPPRGVSAFPGRPPQKGEAPVACEECHKLIAADGPANASIPTAEFAAVPYAKCLECHADYRVAVHGRDENGAACYACHAKAASPAEITSQLKTVELADTGGKWKLVPRAHDFQKDECLKCHVTMRNAEDHRPEMGAKLFRHDHHLRTTSVEKGGELAFSQECLACHKSLAGSDSLAASPTVDTSGCATCHVASEPKQDAASGAKRTVVDMVHRVHLADAASLAPGPRRFVSRESLAKGCLSCHALVAGEAPMGFAAGAKDCKACHTGHENVGEGKCVLCHVDRTPGVNGEKDGRPVFRFNEPGIFDRAKATLKTTAAMPRFDHRSRGHAGHACAECHAAENVDSAMRVLDVAWPAFDEDACVKCHLQTRFHR